VTPAKWSSLAQLAGHFSDNLGRYAVQFALWLAIFTLATALLGQKPAEFVPAFIFLYLVSVLILALGQWDQANRYN